MWPSANYWEWEFRLLTSGILVGSKKTDFNKYLKSNVMLAETQESVGFISKCVRWNQYPNHRWPVLDICQVPPNTRLLWHYGFIHFDAAQSSLDEMCCSVISYQISSWGEVHWVPFEDYAETICRKTPNEKQNKSHGHLDPTVLQSRFFVNHHSLSPTKLSNLQVGVLSLELTFCMSQSMGNLIEINQVLLTRSLCFRVQTVVGNKTNVFMLLHLLEVIRDGN